MTWTAPGTATAGEVLTAAFWNTQVRDNFLQLRSLVNVQSTFKEDVFTSSGTHTTFQDVTGLSVTITPRETSSRVLIYFSINIASSTGNPHLMVNLVRGSTNIAVPTTSLGSFPATIGFSQAVNTDMVQMAFMFVDSPSTTSATTYKLQARSSANNTFYVNQRGDTLTRSTSTITAVEIPS